MTLSRAWQRKKIKEIFFSFVIIKNDSQKIYYITCIYIENNFYFILFNTLMTILRYLIIKQSYKDSKFLRIILSTM